jgi:hypothetical protein
MGELTNAATVSVPPLWAALCTAILSALRLRYGNTRANTRSPGRSYRISGNISTLSLGDIHVYLDCDTYCDHRTHQYTDRDPNPNPDTDFAPAYCHAVRYPNDRASNDHFHAETHGHSNDRASDSDFLAPDGDRPPSRNQPHGCGSYPKPNAYPWRWVPV